MPDSKTIEIDEVIPPKKGAQRQTSQRDRAKEASKDYTTGQAPRSSSSPDTDPPFPDIASTLGWKARIMFMLTQWFLVLRSKPWGKWVIGPVIVLGILLAVPLALITILAVFIIALLRPFLAPRR